MKLYDYVVMDDVLETEDENEALAFVGAFMSAFGPENARGRFLLFEPIERSANVRVILDTEKLWERALAYFDADAAAARGARHA